MVGVDAVERRPPSLEGPSSSLVTDVEDEVEELEEVYEAELLESPPRLVEEVSGDGEGLEINSLFDIELSRSACIVL
ncbi:hypothetical protein TYRP_011115 [Tyrophagus putrescentiae]|nr:hypothetical protein TYRP_011115 [Tyrophagus putrescentiae]